MVANALIARFMGPTWDQPGADRTLVGPMLAAWTLLSGWTCAMMPRLWQGNGLCIIVPLLRKFADSSKKYLVLWSFHVFFAIWQAIEKKSVASDLWYVVLWYSSHINMMILPHDIKNGMKTRVLYLWLSARLQLLHCISSLALSDTELWCFLWSVPE